ncbi:MAG: hypothetical protein AAFN07_10015 [Pseudomonadota bacterium]
MEHWYTNEEYAALKRARRLLRLCDLAMSLEPNLRRSFLQTACADDPQLLEEAAELLQAVRDSRSFMLSVDSSLFKR